MVLGVVAVGPAGEQHVKGLEVGRRPEEHRDREVAGHVESVRLRSRRRGQSSSCTCDGGAAPALALAPMGAPERLAPERTATAAGRKRMGSSKEEARAEDRA